VYLDKIETLCRHRKSKSFSGLILPSTKTPSEGAAELQLDSLLAHSKMGARPGAELFVFAIDRDRIKIFFTFTLYNVLYKLHALH